MKPRHTPGPLDWMFVGAEANGHVYLIDANNRKIASLWGKSAEKMANANLYAAAPDMLAALRDAVLWCRRCDGSGRAPNENWVSTRDETHIDCPDCKTPRAAIRRAELSPLNDGGEK